MVEPLKFVNGWVILSNIYWVCDDLSLLGFKLIEGTLEGIRN